VDPNTRVCPFCGEPPGEGVFCAACGRNLAAVDQLPTAAEYGERTTVDPAGATAAFLDAMRADGNPGAADIPAGKPTGLLGRTKKIRGWVLRAVDREDFEEPKRYVPGLVLTVEGEFHRLDSELRGHGQRDFPYYHHSASADPIEPPLEPRLVGELAAVRAANEPTP